MSSCDMMDGGLHYLLDPVFMVAAAGYTAWIAISHVCQKIADASCNISKAASNFLKNNFFKSNDINDKNPSTECPEVERAQALNVSR